MRIEQLEYLAAVTRAGSLRRAARELHVSQPALSETIRNLERELAVTLLDRRRSGAGISADGRELLPYIMDVLEAVDRLGRAAGERREGARTVRLGTVNSATVPLLAPAIQAFRRGRPDARVEVLQAQQADIHRQLLEGSLDLGLVNALTGDDLPPDLDSTRLLRGRVVACVRPGGPLAALAEVGPGDLLAEPLIVMRAGYLMHRYVHRLFGGRTPPYSYSADGAEMGKLLVAEGLGATLLPDFSVVGDPLERAGVITVRPLADPAADVALYLQTRRSPRVPGAVAELHRALVRQAARAGSAGPHGGGDAQPGPQDDLLPLDGG
ncbi:LysR family transcriptional regulator [Actinocorallia sp. API 0066]|uniref:LysR family transcriptional regulator n=1 Tax=Actinocorallia sp. API 0066 TaxID=2896846 RepID=UPI001E49C6F0|nr:LysR family transcriptional regulator [Actinocorallia sp. API 0066]MCD0448573.1 LysR family transcriptional regulator [Actinocorallia sp. API 0066]